MFCTWLGTSSSAFELVNIVKAMEEHLMCQHWCNIEQYLVLNWSNELYNLMYS